MCKVKQHHFIPIFPAGKIRAGPDDTGGLDVATEVGGLVFVLFTLPFSIWFALSLVLEEVVVAKKNVLNSFISELS